MEGVTAARSVLGGHRMWGCMGSAPPPQEGSRNRRLPPDSAKETCCSHLHPESKACGGHSPLLGNPSAPASRRPTVTHPSTPLGQDTGPWRGDRGFSTLNTLSCLCLDPKRPWAGSSRCHAGQTVLAASAVTAVHAVWTHRGSTSHNLLAAPPATTAMQETGL